MLLTYRQTRTCICLTCHIEDGYYSVKVYLISYFVRKSLCFFYSFCVFFPRSLVPFGFFSDRKHEIYSVRPYIEIQWIVGVKGFLINQCFPTNKHTINENTRAMTHPPASCHSCKYSCQNCIKTSQNIILARYRVDSTKSKVIDIQTSQKRTLDSKWQKGCGTNSIDKGLSAQFLGFSTIPRK